MRLFKEMMSTPGFEAAFTSFVEAGTVSSQSGLRCNRFAWPICTFIIIPFI